MVQSQNNSDEITESNASLALTPKAFNHAPVMCDEIVAHCRTLPRGVLVDATLGGGGHSEAILHTCTQLTLLGVDQDDIAIRAASDRLATYRSATPLRAVIVKSRFDRVVEAAENAFPRTPIVGALFDLGVSSPQLDESDRGFSYRNNGPLDMRMNRSEGQTAKDLLSEIDEFDLEQLLRQGGEERFAGRIAHAICAARPIDTTHQLAEVVREAIPAPARRRSGDPAKRTFQAIRIAVNDELRVLQVALDSILHALAPGGRLMVLSYHSGEDRIVKACMRQATTGGCQCDMRIGCNCGARPTMRVVRGAKKPRQTETARNPRARSARLRVVEAIGADDEGKVIA